MVNVACEIDIVRNIISRLRTTFQKSRIYTVSKQEDRASYSTRSQEQLIVTSLKRNRRIIVGQLLPFGVSHAHRNGIDDDCFTVLFSDGNICNEVIRNLKTLDLETNSLTELIIINLLISKVDACISQRWELSLENNKIPTLEEFRVFIEREAPGLNELKFVKPDIKKGNVKPLNSFNKSNVNTTVVKCNQVKSGVKPDVVKVSPSADTQANSVVTVSNNCTQSAEGHVLLSTALINVKSKHGEQITCRALIDNASQNSLISKQCNDRLKLPLKHTNHKLVGVNETFAETSLYSTNFEFSSCVSSDKFQVKALLVSKVTSAMPNFPIKYHEWPHTKDLTLADPTFYIENEIDILLGADVFMTLISGTPIMGPKGTSSALPTKLGHLLSGTT
ncbi:DUF1758 domain-containing protein [Trichonephila clavipes]|nr:DUF1758 domain-containing protein [Trichonephila clavipes]